MLHEVEELASARCVTQTWRAIQRLCLYSPDTTVLGAILRFLSQREAIETFEDWADESTLAPGMAALGRTLWSKAELQRAMIPYSDASTTKRIFGKEIKVQYPAALCATRRPLCEPDLAAWLHKLRCYLLLRSLDAESAGVAREHRLYRVSLTVRQAIDSVGDPALEWLAGLSHQALGLADFEVVTLRLVEAAIQDPKAPESAVRASFLKALKSLLQDEPWVPMEVVGWSPDTSATNFGRDAPQPSGHGSLSPNPPRQSPPKQRQRIGKRKTLTRARLEGESLRLQSAQASLHFAPDWDTCTQEEVAGLLRCLNGLLLSSCVQDHFGAACCLIAVVTSQSAHGVRSVPFQACSDHAWHINAAKGVMRRRAPRRQKRWRATPTVIQQGWAVPLENEWAYALSAPLRAALQSGLKCHEGGRTLGEVWHALSPNLTLEAWINARLAEQVETQRLRSPALANILPAAILRTSGDAQVARLLSSDNRSALPAATAYFSVTGQQVHCALAGLDLSAWVSLVTPNPHDARNAAGSELDLLTPNLHRFIADLLDRAQAACDRADWVEGHNLLACVTTLVLLASTGARPVRAPFETLRWFCFQHKLVYLLDKVSGPTRGARLGVLSDWANDFLTQVYLPHLERLADALAVKCPDFSRELRALTCPTGQSKLPLLFVVRCVPEIDWMEMSEAALDEHCPLDQGLPWNLFRHWMSSGLNRHGLHPDVRDALMGHADFRLEAHGDNSPRTPIADLEQARAVINQLQEALPWRLISLPASWPAPAKIDLAPQALDPKRSFGAQARAQRRAEGYQRAQDSALKEVLRWTQGRPANSFSADELESLARCMLFQGSRPHPAASLRYEVFESWLQHHWEDSGRRAPLQHRYSVRREGQALFTEMALTARAQLEGFRAQFEAWCQEHQCNLRGPEVCATAAAIELVLLSRVAFMDPLKDVLCNTVERYIVVRMDQRDYLEWGFGADWVDGKPVYRLPISARAGAWLSNCRAQSRRHRNALPAIPGSMLSLADWLQLGVKETEKLLERLVELQSQANSLELPGFIAAHLGGRRCASALPHRDWIRLVRSARPIEEDVTSCAEATEQDAQQALDRFQAFVGTRTTTAEELPSRASRLRTQVLSILSEEQALLIRERVSKLHAVACSSGFGQGDALFLLVHFIAHLLTRRPRSGGRPRLALSTSRRYAYSLMTPFVEALADCNILQSEPEELIERYQDALETWQVKPGAMPPSADGIAHGLDAQSATQETADASRRTAAALKEFHEFIERSYGACGLDWAELALDGCVAAGRPGFIKELEVQSALQQLTRNLDVTQLDPLTLERAFVLVVCHRFGLRAREAIGLRFRDWIEQSGATLVAVVPHRLRSLKRLTSKRLVPLLEPLTALEESVIREVLLRWQRREGADHSKPLLVHFWPHERARSQELLCEPVRQALRSVTGSSSSTLHTLRHAYAMRMTALVLQLELPGETPRADPRAVRAALGLPNQVDRRALWAIARLLGHASPLSTVASYLNSVWLWHPTVNERAQGVTAPIPNERGRVNLDPLRLDPHYLDDACRLPLTQWPLHLAQPPSQQLAARLQYLRQLRLNQSKQRACEVAGLTIAKADGLEKSMVLVGARLDGPSKRSHAATGGWDILKACSANRLRVLIEDIDPDLRVPRSHLQNWVDMVGASRQIMLFEKEHFHQVRWFLEAFTALAGDVRLVHRTNVHPDLISWAEGAGLKPLLLPISQVSKRDGTPVKGFQMDVARSGPHGTVHPERIALIPAHGGKLTCSQEMLLMWIVWNTLGELVLD